MKYILVICILILSSVIAIDDIIAQRDNATKVVDVYNPKTGKTWMDRNLGASRAATSQTDTQAYGDLYQWGRGADGHQKRNSINTSITSNTDSPGHGNFIVSGKYSETDWRMPQNNNLWQGMNGVNNPCPIGYRIPTSIEWWNELKSWTSNDSDGAFSSPLKLPMAGSRVASNGTQDVIFLHGWYWSSLIENSSYAPYIYIGKKLAELSVSVRGNGGSVRCIKD